MTTTVGRGAPLFACDGFAAHELQRADVPALQALFEANPEYFRRVNGRDALPDEALREFEDDPPPHLPFGRRWIVGLYEQRGALAGVADVVADLCAPRIWHLGLFWLATCWHGRGVAQPLLAATEDWMRAQGAEWVRLGVVVGNVAAERFWARHGYTQVRLRCGIDTGGRTNDIRVLVKRLHGDETLKAYLDRVPRDRPDSPLP